MYPEFQATRRYELIEFNIPANSTGTRFNFVDQPQLRTDTTQDVVVQGIEIFDVTDVTLSPNNITVATAAYCKSTFLVLYVDGEESIYRIPLFQLHRVANLADPYINVDNLPPPFDNIYPDWTKSYLFTPTAYSGGANATFSFLFGIHYKKLPPGTMGKIRANEYTNYNNIRMLQPIGS